MNNKEIFDKYNPSSDVVRCPNGQAIIRLELDKIARAAVSLYGVLKLDEFVSIYNLFYDEQLRSKDVYILLLPFARKSKKYFSTKIILLMESLLKILTPFLN